MLEVKDLTYLYEDGTKALENINIELGKGKKIGIIGANGSGKSTLFLNMVGVLKPKRGKIVYNGEDIKYSKKYLREYRKKVNIVFQDPDKQIFYSNVYDDIAFALRNIGYSEEEIKNRVDKVLKRVGAYDFKDKPVHFLSYGQKKRVAIAGILVMDGDIILFDEPTSGLDPLMTREIVSIIDDISKNKTIVISSHDMNLIYEICDYVYVLENGNVIDEGLVTEVFTKEKVLKKAGLEEPWLVKIHKRLGIPLFKYEEDFFNYWRDRFGSGIDWS
ncbi:energy-coupling factor ABC transporter ATP-binding protein [Anaerosalibacter massiliensis]|uniref:ABC transporter ATP-binding protein n=1 Tax=Anaerosalibacter massiliensis TaxID=1347392 RepID=A0A9X2MIA4_9FIRM|nr:ATP-binding cassette domain-containing protein [Anaerosalibacter massiliensis]MCR2043692.1 ATP-binding cassette domain-containing protein [Anaerosalibacter massiliensis]